MSTVSNILPRMTVTLNNFQSGYGKLGKPVIFSYHF